MSAATVRSTKLKFAIPNFDDLTVIANFNFDDLTVAALALQKYKSSTGSTVYIRECDNTLYIGMP